MEKQESARRQIVTLNQPDALMRTENISLKIPTISILIVLGLVSILLLVTNTLYFRKAALKSQSQSLSRVMDVSVHEVLKQLHEQIFNMGNSFQARPEFRDALEKLRQGGGNAALRKALDDPIVKGFVGADTVDLVKLRVYDSKLNLVAQSDAGIQGLAPILSQSLFGQAAGRSGADRLKALGSLWISSSGPLYSVLLPIGGLKLSGYLEVVVNPTFNFASVAAMTRMPLTVYSASGEKLYQSEGAALERRGRVLAVDYLLHSSDGRSAYRLKGLADVAQFNADIARSGISAILAFVVLIGMAVLVGLWFFNRLPFFAHAQYAKRNGTCRAGGSVGNGRT